MAFARLAKLNAKKQRMACKCTGSVLLLLLSLAALTMSFVASKPVVEFNVCIVGAGIAGTSTAFFLREYQGFDQQVNIHLFEQKDDVGGRIASFPYVNPHSKEFIKHIDAGGAVIHKNNRYMMQFAAMSNLSVQKPGESSQRMGIYNGKEFVFQSSRWKWLDAFAMMWRYGTSLFTMKKFVSKMISQFDRIYEIQDNEEAFESPEDLLKRLDVYDLTQKDLATTMMEAGVSPKLINELVAAINRVNYNQNCTLNGFAGTVGLAGSGDDLRSVQGGNKQIVYKILARSGAVLHEDRVTEIIKVSNEKYLVSLASQKSQMCDAVVIATPLELTNIELPSFAKRNLSPPRKYQLTQTTFVRGMLRAKFFGLPSPKDIPEVILTTENATLKFSSIGVQYKELIEGKASDSYLYKVFSRQALTDDTLQDMFEAGFDVIQTYPWRQGYRKNKCENI